jgi:16S rRNA (guanine527-N7)-methyltransferase
MTAATPRGETDDACFRHQLDTAAVALGITLSARQADQLLGYLASLQRWNSVYNLTSVREPNQMLRLHLLDCLALINPLRRQLGMQDACRLLDVGSGAGLPGAVIAIADPSISVTCVDAVGKKAAFVQQVAAELSLPNLTSIHSRIEDLKAAPYPLITSRAFASLADFVRLTRPNLAPGGTWLAMKGKLPRDEMLQLPTDIEVFHVEPLVVPGLGAKRCLVWMQCKG